MDDVKVFVKNEKELENLIQIIRIFSQDIGIKFGIDKYTMLIMKTEERVSVEGIELQNQGCIRMFGEKENYKYLEIFKADMIKQAEIRKEYPRRTRKPLETKPCMLYSDLWARNAYGCKTKNV